MDALPRKPVIKKLGFSPTLWALSTLAQGMPKIKAEFSPETNKNEPGLRHTSSYQGWARIHPSGCGHEGRKLGPDPSLSINMAVLCWGRGIKKKKRITCLKKNPESDSMSNKLSWETAGTTHSFLKWENQSTGRSDNIFKFTEPGGDTQILVILTPKSAFYCDTSPQWWVL